MSRYEELINQATEILENDDDIFVEAVNELDSWDGYADGFRGFPMWELDELFGDCKVSEFLEKLADDFNIRDEYFIDTIYGLSSTDDLADVYRDNTDVGDVLDSLIDNYAHIYISDSDFSNLLEEIVNYSEDDDDETA